ncbi:MAG TPA: family 10 glycosylhydrolase [Candidatus Omnitrophota bacterium]|nr:family 10 glycosylhydrolase [Candidatus Omnitrophota bacterium]
MKKNIFIFFLCSLLAFSGPATCQEPLRRGLFVSLVQDPPVLSSREGISKLISFSKQAGIGTLFVQIYRANQSWFPSKIADPSPYETALKNLREDPLALLVKLAHQEGIQVHAWLNMLSLSVNERAPLLEKYGTSILTRNLQEKKTLEDYKIDAQYFLEPGDTRVRKDLTTMVEEILSAYPDLDGIQFDYFRYPDRNPAYGYTEENTQRFKKATGLQAIEEQSEVWKNWKRDQVTEFLEMLIHRTRALRPDIQVSVTGCMPYARAYHEAFQDWGSWLDRGMVNFVTMMNYSPSPVEYERWITGAKKKILNFKKVNIGVGAYKLVALPEIFAQEFRICEKAGGRACVVFHYGSLLENPALKAPFWTRGAESKS